jgi:hypothetical protein
MGFKQLQLSIFVGEKYYSCKKVTGDIRKAIGETTGLLVTDAMRPPLSLLRSLPTKNRRFK